MHVVVLLLLCWARVVSCSHLEQAHPTRHSRHREQTQESGSSGDMGGPECPPSVRPVSQELCEVKRCYSHSECPPDPAGNDTSWLERELRRRACCYNGCVYSCMWRMPPPAVFDWLEETPDSVTDTEDDTTAAHVAPPVVVALPGGCVLTHSDFIELQGFEKSKYVEKCYCKDGEVFCKFEHSLSSTHIAD